MVTAPADLFEGLGHALSTDYFFLREQLTEQQLEVLRRVRLFVDDEVLPVIGDYWERAEMPWPLIQRLGELGIVGEDIQGYGCPGFDPISLGLIHMELNRGDGSLGTVLGVQAGLAMKSIAMLGSEEQKQRWLPPMARVEQFGAFALTEPNHGSDSVALETSARRVGDTYVLNGAKRWIGAGSFADVVVVWARDEEGKVGGFLVEGGTPGYDAHVIEGKGSLRAIWQAQISLEDVEVPAENRLPGAHSFKDTARVLAGTRSTCAWAALGHAVAAYDDRADLQQAPRAVRQAAVQLPDRPGPAREDARRGHSMQLYCLQIGRLAERGELSDTIAGLAKLNNTRKARQICAEARDMLGGNGILLENHVIRHMADIEAIHTYEGTETMQTLIVGRDITGVGAFA